MSLYVGMSKRRLRVTLAAFTLALAVPGLMLVYQALTQMKWESYRQYQVAAEELASRVNSGLVRIVEEEEARAFADYAFLSGSANQNNTVLQRSPISILPGASSIPGLVGYFQVDDQGRFTSPLLPDSSMNNVGLSVAEWNERSQIQDQLMAILSSNRLVQGKRSVAVSSELLKDSGEASRRADEAALSAPASAMLESSISVQEEFDQLAQKTDSALSKSMPMLKQQPSSQLGRVEELNLQPKFEEKSQEAARAKALSIEPAKKKEARSEAVGKGQVMDKKVTAFQSEVDPFSFNRLASGHFVLFRKAWVNGQRFTQGLVIDAELFIAGVVNTPFQGSSLSGMSDLVVAYEGDVLSLFNGRQNRSEYLRASELRGDLLYRTRFSAPFSELEMIFSINDLPAGAGARVVGWVTLAFACVLLGGVVFMYLLGCRQIALAQQQQNFISSVSHELKTPLTSIRMYAEMLSAGWADEEKKQSYYRFIFDESERLSRLINNVLQLARMTRNDAQLQLHPIALSAVLDNLRSKLATQVERSGFELLIQNEVSDTTLHIDGDAFTQVMINLVDNALKFSAKAQTKRIEVTTSQGGGYVVFSVRDYGPGIPKNQLKKIFQLFYRSESELTRATTGTGIGLALVQQLVILMNGKIDVINRQPGAEFRVSLPV